MNAKIITRGLTIIATMILLSCSKDGGEPPIDGGGPAGLEGKLLYTFVGKVHQLDLHTNIASLFFTYNTYGFVDWDMGRDHQYRLISEREPGEFFKTRFTLVKNEGGLIVDAFDYIAPNGNDTNLAGQLSPDNSKVLIKPSLESGIVVTDLDGNHLYHFETINVKGTDVSLGLGDEALWLPDNSILFSLADRYILESPPPYTTISLVREMPYTEWGNLHVNHAGTKLALQINDHIHIMGVDGSEPVQVTESSLLEYSAIFSPDDRYLAVAKKYSDVGYFNLAIIPNDGQRYNMDTDKAVIRIQPRDETILAAVDGQFFWMP